MSSAAAVPGEPRADAGVRSVLRALDLLGLFTEERLSWTVRDLTAVSGLAKTTVLRLVSTLERRGLLWSEPDGRITVGPGLLRWSNLARTAWQVPESARGTMRELAAATGETVNLYVRADRSRICIEQQEGTGTVRHLVRVGDELPLWAGAASKVLLSDVDDEVLAAVLEHDPRRRAASAVRAEVTAAAQAGFAVSHGEREVGASGVAAPVVDEHGRVLAALAVGGPTPRFTERAVEEFSGAVIDAAARISRIGFGGET
ncbi:IclR family transcriptional regulator [Salinifilum aidingensis]